MSIKTKIKMAILLLLIAGGALFVWIYNQEGFTGSRVANPEAYSLDIESMNGTDRHTLELTAGDTLQIQFETRKGSLHMEITAPDQTVLYAGTGKDTTVFTVNIPKSGAYAVVVEARHARGNIHIQLNGSSKATDMEPAASTEPDSAYTADWSDITVGGLDENAFVQKLDTEVLQDIAAKLQSLVEEERAEERENQEIILSEGFTRVFKKELYLEVVDMGNKAEMPLYYILYKSPNNDMYEYICAVALSELMGLDFMNESGDYYDWSSGKEYLELFNDYMLQNQR